MKKLILYIFVLISLSASAQDLITKRNGDEISAKVMEITDTEVKYKKWSNQDGPTYAVKKSEIFMIKYPNGEKDVFNEDDAKVDSGNNSAPIQIAPTLDSDNLELIKRYNEPLLSKCDAQGKGNAKYATVKYGIKKESVMSSEDLEIGFELIRGYREKDIPDVYFYAIVLKNKSNSTIFVDLGNSVRTNGDGSYHVYFDNSKTTTVSNSTTTGVGLALGGIFTGIGLSSSSTSGISTTYSTNRILKIPPHSQARLIDDIIANEKDYALNKTVYNGKYVQEVEYILDTKTSIPSNTVAKDQVKTYEEEDAISKLSRDYVITYSKSEDFSAYSIVRFGLFAQQIFGIKANSLWSPTVGNLMLLDTNHINNKLKKLFPNFTKQTIIGQISLSD